MFVICERCRRQTRWQAKGGPRLAELACPCGGRYRKPTASQRRAALTRAALAMLPPSVTTQQIRLPRRKASATTPRARFIREAAPHLAAAALARFPQHSVQAIARHAVRLTQALADALTNGGYLD